MRNEMNEYEAKVAVWFLICVTVFSCFLVASCSVLFSA